MDLNEKEATEIDNFVLEKTKLIPVITAQNLCSINSCPDQQMYRARIQFLFQLEGYVVDMRGVTDQVALEALIDMVHDAILFSADNSLPYAKSIVFLTIFILMIQYAISSSFYEPETLYKRFQQLLLEHSIDRPPRFNAIFELPDLKLINEYFTITFFRNLKMFLYCFTPKPVLAFRSTFPIKVSVPSLPALAEMEMEAPPAVEEPKDQFDPKPQASSRFEGGEKNITVSRQISEPDKLSNVEKPVHSSNEPEDRGPEVPIDILRNNLNSMHEKFVTDFEEKEKQLMGKIKEIEIKLMEKQNQKKATIKPKK